MKKEIVKQQISDSIKVKTELLNDQSLLDIIDQAADVVTKAYQAGNKTLLAGNGGSAADAQHIAGEFVSRFYFDRPGLPSIAMNTDTSIVTAIGNDYGYDKLYARQIQAQGVKGDVFIGISTSGNSSNILAALHEAKEKGIFTIGLTGKSGGKMAELCDICIKVPSTETPRIQESHILIGHIICCIVEDTIFSHLKK
ncbi:MAG: phosphoheptose isomerase [Pseudopedobacter saltans]|uniref:Phosphoheptose isomerase n=1 Tax=Pseudopedobacter saltans TaxID=151895 RepID=A0A2W5GC39_9SPHI|nr:MAG: phosphoheptose isomerase [Pseudopedobacter saltans]